MKMLLHNQVEGQQLCQQAAINISEVHLRFPVGRLILIIIILLVAPSFGCATLDEIAKGENSAPGDSWFNVDPIAPVAIRYTVPAIISPLVGDEISTSDESFKPFVYCSTLGTNLSVDQIDLHKANLISLLTNKSSRGSIAPWEGSIELGQQMPSTSIWLASLELKHEQDEAKYEPNFQLALESEQISMGTLAMAWIDDANTSNSDPLTFVTAQNPLGIAQPGLTTGVSLIASTAGSSFAWGEIISTSMRWIAMVFLAVVLLIPAGCSYAARLVVDTRSRSSPHSRRRRSNDRASSAISRAIANVATH